MSSRDLSTVIKTQKAFIKELLDRLEKKEIKTIDLDIAKENAELKTKNERLEEKYNVASFECNNLRELKMKYRQALQEIRDKLDFNKRELEECLHNPIDDEIREIINSVIGTK